MKFSIITPVYNGEKYIAETIESVLSQEGDFEIEYLIEDGGSTDETLTIIKSYAEKTEAGTYRIKCTNVSIALTSEKDNGMYDAINKGFARATGDIYAYINADDTYSPGAFSRISRTFIAYPEIHWLKGITSYLYDDGRPPQRGTCHIYNQKWIVRGIYGRNAYFIQQDSVFWKKEIWKKVGGSDTRLRYAGDYDLWIRFAKITPLWSLNALISSFRKREGQLSSNMGPYREEQRKVSQEEGFATALVKLFFWIRTKIPQQIKGLYDILYPLVFWQRNRYYVDIDEQGDTVIRKTSKFTIK